MASLSQNFGRKIRELRKSQRLTQEEVGERAELHPTYIGAIERGEQSPSLETVEKLAAGFGIDPKALFDFKIAEKNPPIRTALQKRLLGLLRRRSERELRLGVVILEDAFKWAKELHK